MARRPVKKRAVKEAPAAKKKPPAKKPVAKRKPPAKKPVAKKQPAAKKRAAAAKRRVASVVAVVESDSPAHALRALIKRLPAHPTTLDSQEMLGAALLALAAHPSRAEADAICAAILPVFARLSARAPSHGADFLRNALTVPGAAAMRDKLLALVPAGAGAGAELRFAAARAFGRDGDRRAIAHAVAALAAGIGADTIRRAPELAALLDTPELRAALDATRPAAQPADTAADAGPLAAALAALVARLRTAGDAVVLGAPASADAIAAAGARAAAPLPNDVRALYSLHDGLTLGRYTFLATADHGAPTPLGERARAFLADSADAGFTGIDRCVPIANWGQPNDWLLYDPTGAVRQGEPGLVVVLTADALPLDDVLDALRHIARLSD